mgnify:CR=1 FL=1
MSPEKRTKRMFWLNFMHHGVATAKDWCLSGNSWVLRSKIHQRWGLLKWTRLPMNMLQLIWVDFPPSWCGQAVRIQWQVNKHHKNKHCLLWWFETCRVDALLFFSFWFFVCVFCRRWYCLRRGAGIGWVFRIYQRKCGARIYVARNQSWWVVRVRGIHR